MSFHVGQSIVCVDASASRRIKEGVLVRGRIYIVRGFAPKIFEIDTPGIYLEGLALEKRKIDGTEYAFKIERFRPIVERKTDISIFTTMLDGVKQGETA